MKVRRIALSGFRNYDWESFDFSPDTNVIRGENGQGKTNLLEAVYMLSCGRSFRTRLDRDLVGFGFSSAEILSDIESHGREQTVKMVLSPGQRKQITVNSVKKSASELAGTLTSVLFCPDDLELVKEGAAVRRRLMDTAISQLRPNYARLVSEFSRLYEQKSSILREWREKPSLLDTLDDFSARMCAVSAKLVRYRAAFVSRLAKSASPIHREFSGGADELELSYQTVSTVRDPFGPEKEIFYDICEHQERHRRAEIDSGQCLTGAHKDDIVISINGRSARTFGSQGQKRTAALSIKLAEREIHLQETGEYPVLLLDDVLSELDAKRQDYVLNRIGEGQTLITCCEDDGIASRTGGRVLTISGGKLV